MTSNSILTHMWQVKRTIGAYSAIVLDNTPWR